MERKQKKNGIVALVVAIDSVSWYMRPAKIQ